MSTTVHFEHQVEGLAHPVVITAEFDAGDRSVGINPGWFLVEAELQVPPAERKRNSYLRGFTINRDNFRLWFGDEALQVAEEAAADHEQGLREQAECDRAEAYAEMSR